MYREEKRVRKRERKKRNKLMYRKEKRVRKREIDIKGINKCIERKREREGIIGV